jgi:hypothetical protein
VSGKHYYQRALCGWDYGPWPLGANSRTLANGLEAHSTWCAAHKPRDQNGSPRLRVFSGTGAR